MNKSPGRILTMAMTSTGNKRKLGNRTSSELGMACSAGHTQDHQRVCFQGHHQHSENQSKGWEKRTENSVSNRGICAAPEKAQSILQPNRW